jgi:hypothetical protein
MLGRAQSADRKNTFGRGNRFAEQRRNRRRRNIIFFIILLLSLLIVAVYGLRQDAIRVSHTEIIGADSSFESYAISAMQGNYFGIIPRDSIFFFPESRIRDQILIDHPDIAAVSLSRNGFTDISINVAYRVPVARWCGSTGSADSLQASSSQTVSQTEACYVFDASGFIYASVATTTEPINTFSLYAPLIGDTPEPLRATIANTEKLPSVFNFARQLGMLGASTTKIVIRTEGEVDDILANGTRITHLLGDEQNAFTALVSAGEGINLSSGTIDYVDLRFDGKVYLKKK